MILNCARFTAGITGLYFFDKEYPLRFIRQREFYPKGTAFTLGAINANTPVYEFNHILSDNKTYARPLNIFYPQTLKGHK